jgi:hypothetical protein
MSPTARVPRRPVLGTEFDASMIGFDLDIDRLGPVSGDERTAAFLRRARAAGVTTFRIPAGSPLAERLLAASLDGPAPQVLTLEVRNPTALVRDAAVGDSSGGDSDLFVRLRDSVRSSASRLGAVGHRIVEWRAENDLALDEAAPLRALDRLRREGEIASYAVPLRADGDPDSAEATKPPRTPLRVGALSLLQTHELPRLEREAPDGLGYFALDPFAEGRLDGSAFGSSIAGRRPDSPPRSVRELHREFDPVLRLGFLTESRERTLSQAALQFVLAWHWVTSVLIPLPSPETLEEILDASEAPPLTETEIERALRSE